MSQYFHPRRSTASSATEHPTPFLPRINDRYRDDRSDIDLESSNNRIATSPILIFPNPPEEQESSRSALGSGSGFEFSGSSTLSLPTDVSLESLQNMGESLSRGEGERMESWNERWQSVLPTLPRDSGWNELLPEEQQLRKWEPEMGFLRPHNPRCTSYPLRGHHTRTPSGISSPLMLLPSLSPQPPFRLPFLSSLQSFLTLDDSTLHLISRSPEPQISSLFPVPPSPHSDSHLVDDEDGAATDDLDSPHGTLKLLLSNPDKPQSISLLKAGIDPSETPGDGNSLLMSPTRIPVWRLLEFVLEGCVRAWKEARAWNAGDMQLMGV